MYFCVAKLKGGFAVYFLRSAGGDKMGWTRGHFSESLYWHCCDIHSMLHNLNHNRLLCIQSMIDKLEKERLKFDFF